MSNKLRILLIILAAILLITAIVLLFIKKPTPTTSTSQNKTQPQVSFQIPSQSDQKMNVYTSAGTTTTANIYNLSKEKLSLNGVAFEKNSNFYISFYPQDQGFIITILNKDIQLGRDLAEQAFLRDLAITETEACKLKITLNVPFDINAKASGNNYGLSFCPNSKSF